MLNDESERTTDRLPVRTGPQVDGTPRICFLAEAFPPIPGGQEIHAYELATRLAAAGAPLFVLTRLLDPASPTDERLGAVRVQRFPPVGNLQGAGWRAVGKNLKVLGRALILLDRLAPSYDLILVSGLRLLSMPALLVAMIRGKRCVIKSESPSEFWQRPLVGAERVRWAGLLTVVRRILLRSASAVRTPLVRRADAVVAISAEIRDHWLALGVDPAKIRTIPNGVDVVRFHPVSESVKGELRRRLGLPADRLLLTYTGRLSAAKGVLGLAEVWEEVSRTHPEAHLVLVGSGEHSVDDCECALKDLIGTRRLADRTTLTGRVDNVHEYLQASDLFVFPSEHEGFSLALVEALACGLPALVTRVGAAAEVIDSPRSGVLIPPKDRDALRLGLLTLLEHRSEWVAMGARARETIVERYGFDAVVDQYLRLFRELHRG